MYPTKRIFAFQNTLSFSAVESVVLGNVSFTTTTPTTTTTFSHLPLHWSFLNMGKKFHYPGLAELAKRKYELEKFPIYDLKQRLEAAKRKLQEATELQQVKLTTEPAPVNLLKPATGLYKPNTKEIKRLSKRCDALQAQVDDHILLCLDLCILEYNYGCKIDKLK